MRCATSSRPCRIPGVALAAGRQCAGRAAPTRRHAQTRATSSASSDGTANPDSTEHGGDGPYRLGGADKRRAGLGDRRQLSGGAHHPQFRRALGPHAAAASSRPSSVARRRAVRRSTAHASTTFPTIRRSGRQVTPLDAHIRLANPRTPRARTNLILRRPVQLLERRQQDRPDRPGAAVHRLSGRPREGLHRGAEPPQRRAAGGIHQARRRRLFLRASRRRGSAAAISARGFSQPSNAASHRGNGAADRGPSRR